MASRAVPVPLPMVEQGSRPAMADQGIPAAMADQVIRATMAEIRGPAVTKVSWTGPAEAKESWAVPAEAKESWAGPTLWGARVALTLRGARVALTLGGRNQQGHSGELDGTSRGARVSWAEPAGALG